MRRAAALLPLLWYAQCLPAQECSLDQESQQQVFQSVFRAIPGASRSTDGVLIWELPDAARETFSYGGCVDLGSVISQSIPADVPGSQARVMEIALLLTEKFWSHELFASSLAASALASAIANNEFTLERVDDGEIYHVYDPGFVEIYVEHRFQHGIETVTVAYQVII